MDKHTSQSGCPGLTFRFKWLRKKMIKSIGNFLSTAFGRQAGTKNVFHPTDKCLDCGTPLMSVEAAWCCPNLDCPAQIRGRIAHWC
jgi:NAD-dependent DNA ligase